MKKIIFALFFLICNVSMVFANTITLITNGSVSGTNGQQLKIIESYLQDQFKVSSKITNQNCALSKLLWEKSTEPTLMLIAHGVDGLTDPQNTACFLDIKNENIIFWLYSVPYTFCSGGNKNWNDFTIPNSKHTVAIHTENRSVELFDEISKIYGTKIVTVKINTSSIVLTMMKANEIDFVFRTGISNLQEFNNKCIWSSVETGSLPGIKNTIKNLNIKENKFTINGYIIAKNINVDSVIPILKKAFNSKEMNKIHETRGYDNNLVNFNTELEYKNKMLELFSIIE